MAEGHAEVWHYAGRRTLTSGRMGHLWYDENGKERVFHKLKGTVIGGAYAVKVLDSDAVDANSLMYKSSEPEHESAPEWDLEDKSAYAYHERKSAEKRAARDSRVGELTLDDVRAMLVNAGPRRSAMLAVVLRYIGA